MGTKKTKGKDRPEHVREWGRWASSRPALISVLFILAALVLLMYGASFHSIPVIEEREVATAPPPPELPPPADSFWPFLIEEPPQTSVPAPETERVIHSETEPAVIREVTIGGVARQDSGEIKRTYSGETVPSLCPT